MDDLDPVELPPLDDEEEFERLVHALVAEHTPRRFVVVQELGDRVDARIAGWGLAHPDRVDLIGEDRSLHLGARRADDLLRRFHLRGRVTARIIWCDPPPPPDPS